MLPLLLSSDNPDTHTPWHPLTPSPIHPILPAMSSAIRQLWAPISLHLEAVNYVSPEVALDSLDAFLASSGGTLADQNTTASMLRLQAGLREEIKNAQYSTAGTAAAAAAAPSEAQDDAVDVGTTASSTTTTTDKKKKRKRASEKQAPEQGVVSKVGADESIAADESVAVEEGQPEKKKKRKSKKHDKTE